MVRKCSWLSVLILLLVSTGAQALGLGDIRLESALNQNFKADIELLSVEKGGIADVRVSLASPEAFARAGVERTFLLSRLRYKAERLQDGSAVIHVYTLEPVREPFLNFLIEVNWPKGRLLREYTVLLDPPVTLERKPSPVEAPKSSDTPPPAKKKAVAPPPPPAVAKPAVAPEPAPAVESPPAKPEPEAKPKPPTPDVAADDVAIPADATVGPGDYSVVWGDTMWGIVTRSRIEGVSDKQLMMAIYHANRRAFYGNNINNLKAGEILRIPEKSDALKIDIADADSQYREHVDIWLASKQGDAPTVAAKEEPAAPAELAGGEDEEAKKDTVAAAEESAATEKEDVTPAEESEQEKPEVAAEKVDTEAAAPEAELKIVTARPEGEGEAGPSEGDTADETQARLNRELLLAQEELESARQEGTELESRVGDLESQIEDLQRLITLRSNQLAQLQAHAAETPAEEEAAAVPPTDEGQAEEETDETMPTPLPVDEAQAEEETGAEEAAPATLPVEEKPQAEAEEAAPATLPVEEEPQTGAEETAPATLPIEEETQAEAEEATPPAPPAEEGVEPAVALTPAVPTPEVESIVVPIEEEAAPAVEEEKPVAPPPARRKPEPVPEPGLLDSLLSGTSMLTIGGGLLVVLLLLFLILRRKGGSEDNFEESILLDRGDADVSESTLEEVVEGSGGHTEDTSFLSDFSPSDIDALQDETGEVDPLSEADVYISYGRYQQAEELIRQAIDTDPARQALKHKLFEILYALKDADGFSKLAQESAGTAVETNDADAWDKILSMGKTLDSGNPLFAAAEPMHGAVEEPIEEEPDDGLEDFDLDGIAAELDAEEAAQTTAVDLDKDVSGMDAIEETTLDIGAIATDDDEDAIDDLDLSGLDDDSEMLVELSSDEGADDNESSILTDLSESELVSLNVDDAGEVDTKIDLARAYMDMGDPDGANDILDEVLAEGNDSQKEEAQKLKEQLS